MRKVSTIFTVIFLLPVIASGQPVLEISPDTLNFGYVSVDGSHERGFMLYNTGDEILVVDSILVPSVFSLEPETDITINPGDSLIVNGQFNPDVEDDFSGAWSFYYNNPDNPVYGLDVIAHGVRAFLPGEMIWSFQHIENVVCVTATEDYNGDGFPDVVAEGLNSGSGNINPDIIWSVQPQGGPSNSGGWGDKCLNSASDLNGDGFGDILLGTAWGSRTVFAIDGLSGNTIWSYDTYDHPPTGWVYTVEQTNDVTGDGVDDVLAGAGSDADKAYCFNGATGELIWQYQAEDAVGTIASLSDINEDGFDETVFSCLDYGQYAYCISGASQGTGQPLWMFNTNRTAYSITTIKDINDDDYRDVLVGTWLDENYLYAFSGHRFGNGLIIWYVSVGSPIMRVVTCPDLDGDGSEDILIASWNIYALALSGIDGSEIWRHYTGDDVWAIDYIDDINGDDVPEVIAGSFDFNVYLLDGATGDQIWQFYAGAKLFTVRGIGDVNGDGFADVIAGTQMLGGSGGEVFVISGWQTEPTIVENQPHSLPENYLITSNYPNPFNSSTIIKFNLSGEEEYKLSIYDITGRLVDRFNGIGQAGNNNVIWDLSEKNDIVSGVYLYKLVAGNRIGLGKMTFLK
jgi:outer membrane protein assembly factor BamB